MGSSIFNSISKIKKITQIIEIKSTIPKKINNQIKMKSWKIILLKWGIIVSGSVLSKSSFAKAQLLFIGLVVESLIANFLGLS